MNNEYPPPLGMWDSTEPDTPKEAPRSMTPRSPRLQPDLVDIAKLTERLQCEVKVYRVRVCEHFKDFDGLKSGSISKSLFKRVCELLFNDSHNYINSSLNVTKT